MKISADVTIYNVQLKLTMLQLYTRSTLSLDCCVACFSDGFQALANVIAEFKKLVDHSKFIFVPGPDDVGHATILPRWVILTNRARWFIVYFFHCLYFASLDFST